MAEPTTPVVGGPELNTKMLLKLKDPVRVQPLMVAFATRNGKYLKQQLAIRIWTKHRLPMFRGTIVDEMPFDLKIDAITIDFAAYEIGIAYRFVSPV